MISNHEYLPRIFKMIIIVSFTVGGIKRKAFEDISKSLVDGYGMNAFISLNLLVKEGLVIVSDQLISFSKSRFYELTRKYKLIDINYKEKKENTNRNCFPYLGYTPLLVRLLEIIIRGEWFNPKSIKEDNLPFHSLGDSRDIIYRVVKKPECTTLPKIILYAIGGLTYGEIGAMREMAKITGIELLICTTKVLTTGNFIDVFLG